ncbi:MAG: hypothetical protein IJF47_04090 [Candidatus Methanomethylophilaceae archaeon]|nr:hypothetical protein [Candidatus Methanomethylophilaceae archaeon]
MGKVKLKMVETFAALITSAFGLVAALACNEAIKAVIAEFLDSGNDIFGYLIYAVIVTIIAVIATLLIAMEAEKLKGKEE